MHTQSVVDAIKASWRAETASQPEEWTADNPSRGHCDVSAFVAWEHLGGELVLARVFVNGEQTEHHYWNRIDGEDIDLTRAQFDGSEEIIEAATLDSGQINQNLAKLRPEFAARLAEFRSAVQERLDMVAV